MWFARHFSSASFTGVSDFINGHIDIDQSSSHVGNINGPLNWSLFI